MAPAADDDSWSFKAARAVLATALFTYPATMLTIPVVPGVAIAVLLIGSLALLPFSLGRRAELAAPADYVPVLGLALLFIVGTASAVAWHAPKWELISYFRLFGALALVGAIRLLRPPEWVLYAGCSVGAIGAGAIALVQCFGDGVERASGHDLYFGWQLATIFGLLSIVLGTLPLFAEVRDWPPLVRWLRVAGAIGGIAACLLSGSRGAWLAGAVLMLWRVARVHRYAALAFVVAILLAWAAMPYPAQRWQTAFGELMSYEQGHASTAIGLRLDMWDAAIGAFVQHPWFGVGLNGFDGVLKERSAAGLATPWITHFWHAHNDLLNALATGGIVSAIALVAALWLPWRYFRRADLRERGPALSGSALIVAFVLFGLSDSLFAHRVSLTAYALLVASFLGFTGLPDAAARSTAPTASGPRDQPGP